MSQPKNLLTQKPPLVEAPIGLDSGEPVMVHEKAARYLEDVLLKFPPDADRKYMRRVTSNFNADGTNLVQRPFLLLDNKDPWDVSVLTHEIVDDQNEVIIVKGISDKAYRHYPMVSLQHNYKEFPRDNFFVWPGWNEWTRVQDDISYIGRTVYPRVPTEPMLWKADLHGKWLPEIVFMAVISGILPGNSIGVFPKKVRRPTSQEIEQRQWSPNAKVYEESELVEYAKCAKPVNRRSSTIDAGMGDEIVKKAFQGGGEAVWEILTGETWSEPIVKSEPENPPPDVKTDPDPLTIPPVDKPMNPSPAEERKTTPLYMVSTKDLIDETARRLKDLNWGEASAKAIEKGAAKKMGWV